MSAPVQLVRGAVRAAACDADKPGFSSERCWGEPPAFTIMNRGVGCGPDDQLDTMREFSVRNADMHLLAFGHDISRAGASHG